MSQVELVYYFEGNESNFLKLIVGYYNINITNKFNLLYILYLPTCVKSEWTHESWPQFPLRNGKFLLDAPAAES